MDADTPLHGGSLFHAGSHREAAEARAAFIFTFQTDGLLVFGLIALIDAKPAALLVTIALAPTAN